MGGFSRSALRLRTFTTAAAAAATAKPANQRCRLITGCGIAWRAEVSPPIYKLQSRRSTAHDRLHLRQYLSKAWGCCFMQVEEASRSQPPAGRSVPTNPKDRTDLKAYEPILKLAKFSAKPERGSGTNVSRTRRG